jgi:membrane-bound lytic murein transglycosylase MltF
MEIPGALFMGGLFGQEMNDRRHAYLPSNGALLCQLPESGRRPNRAPAKIRHNNDWDCNDMTMLRQRRQRYGVLLAIPTLAAMVLCAGAPVANAVEVPKIIALPGSAAWTGDFDQMLKRRVVRVLVPFSRTSFFLDKGAALGFEAELGQEFENWINKRYGKKPYRIHVAFVPTPRERLFSDLRDGKGDIAAGNLTVTAEREAVVDFAAPWASGVKEVLVTGPTAPEVHSIEDLGGKTVAVRRSSSYFTHLQHLNDERKKAGQPLIIVEPADENLQDEDLLEMVGSGLLPWTIVDRHTARAWVGLLKGITIRDEVTVAEGGRIAWAIRKNSPLLQKELSEFVSTHKIGTAFGNDLRLRYVTSAKTIRNALADADAKKLKNLLVAFREFGAQYNVDPMLLAGQGYQESGFDQKMKNASGAVGIMQIKPTTAREKQVAINDVVSRAEDNIHAGAKYLRFLADTYISDPDVTPRDQVLMALAAYNAGPGNLRKFRDYATKNGLDRNKWFGNVETGAAAIVGQETVGYIGNIYKYYVVYSAGEKNGQK